MKIDFSQIKTVLLDMDGTLLDLHFDNHFWLTHLPKVYSQQNNITKDQALEVLNPIFKQHSATLNWYCVDFWSDQLGLDIMMHKTEVEAKIAYRPKAQAFLEHCKNQVDDVRDNLCAAELALISKCQHHNTTLIEFDYDYDTRKEMLTKLAEKERRLFIN